MKNENSELLEAYNTFKSTKNIVAYVGVSFIILGIIHSFFSIPPEYIISISCAAFFFVYADYVIMKGKNGKFINGLYSGYLFMGVLSFIVLPVLLLTFPLKFSGFIQSSETFSIISLGLVLVIYNYKTNKSQEKFSDNLIGKLETTINYVERSEKIIDDLQVIIRELKEDNDELRIKIKNDKNDKNDHL